MIIRDVRYSLPNLRGVPSLCTGKVQYFCFRLHKEGTYFFKLLSALNINTEIKHRTELINFILILVVKFCVLIDCPYVS
jgi:hypothetical protein